MKLIVLVGFLGSGKTTCFNALLKQEEENVFCIVNEFGSLSIDSKLLHHAHEIISVTQGSIFCNCKSQELEQAITLGVKQKVSTMVIEASGFSNPSTLNHLVETTMNRLNESFDLSIVCVVDAKHYLKLSKVLPVLKQQVEHAHKVVVNKIDLINETQKESLKNELLSLKNEDDIYWTSQGQVDKSWIISDRKNYSTTSTFQDKNVSYTSFTLLVKGVVHQDDLVALVKEFHPWMIRIKGFIKTDQGNTLLQLVNSQLELSESEFADNQLVCHVLSFECSASDIINLFEKHYINVTLLPN